MVWNYDGRRFRVAQNCATGQTSTETTFHYRQQNDLLWGTYEGGEIRWGTLTGLVSPDGALNFHYTHVNQSGTICSGICQSIPELLPDSRIRLIETWRWTTGDRSAGESVIEELEAL